MGIGETAYLAGRAVVTLLGPTGVAAVPMARVAGVARHCRRLGTSDKVADIARNPCGNQQALAC
jgi:hypothetical protein